MKKLFVMLSILLLSFACSSITPAAGPASEVVVTDPATSIEVERGEVFTIVIESNPSTGYHWEVVGDLNENVVLFVSREYTASEPVLTGSGGVDVWTFKAVSAGETQITLGSYPPGVDGGEPERSVTFNVIVK